MKKIYLNRDIARLIALQRIELLGPILKKIRKLFGRYSCTSFSCYGRLMLFFSTHIRHSEKVFIMKRLLLILILTFNFQLLSKADDIRDFEIEGISIGDSLLEFFDERELIDGIRKESYSSSDLTYVDINLEANWFTEYEGLQITVKRNDNKYIAHSIDGNIFFNRNKKKMYE